MKKKVIILTAVLIAAIAVAAVIMSVSVGGEDALKKNLINIIDEAEEKISGLYDETPDMQTEIWNGLEVGKYIGENSGFDYAAETMKDYCSEKATKILLDKIGLDVNEKGEVAMRFADGEPSYSEYDVSCMEIIDIKDNIISASLKRSYDDSLYRMYIYTFIKPDDNENYIINDIAFIDYNGEVVTASGLW